MSTNDSIDQPPRAALPARFASLLLSPPWKLAGLAGIGGAATVTLLAAIAGAAQLPLLIPPFGASCVLVFALPASPLAQPRNVIGGHVVSAAAGLLALMVLGNGIMTAGAGVGLAIFAMILTRTVHPPAGANPIVLLLTMASWTFLVTPILVGSAAIVILAMAYHRAVTGHAYPAAV
jgi:CBS-domain-containing membrane protein